MYDIDLHPLTGADEVSRDVVVACHYHIRLCVDFMSLLLLFKSVCLFLYFMGFHPLFPMFADILSDLKLQRDKIFVTICHWCICYLDLRRSCKMILAVYLWVMYLHSLILIRDLFVSGRKYGFDSWCREV
jgi:hypothetical protein